MPEQKFSEEFLKQVQEATEKGNQLSMLVRSSFHYDIEKFLDDLAQKIHDAMEQGRKIYTNLAPLVQAALAELPTEKAEKYFDVAYAAAYLIAIKGEQPQVTFDDFSKDYPEGEKKAELREFFANPQNREAITQAAYTYREKYGQPTPAETAGVKEACAAVETIAKITDVKIPTEVKLALDKVNSVLWQGKTSITAEAEEIRLKAEPDKSKKPVTNTVFIWLDELKLNDAEAVQRLSQYDFRVYMAVSNLYLEGNRQVTVNDIYRVMGNPNQKKASQDQRAKIFESIDKMSKIRITIDTSEEQAAGYRYKHTQITRENLLYTKFVVVQRAGNTTEAVEIIEQPCLYRFALERNQYTTIPMYLLESPISKTESSLAIETYLLRRVARNGCRSCTVLFSTLYENVEANTPNKRKSTREKVERILEHWKKQGFIESYTIGKNASKTKPEECIVIKKGYEK